MNIWKNGSFNMLLGAFCIASMGGLIKILGRHFPSVELIFFRNLVGTIIICASVIHRPLSQKGGKFGMLVFRGLIGTFSLFAFFYCITKLQLALANTYNLTYPVFIGIITALILRKPLLRVQWLGILLGFAGVIFIFRPEFNFGFKYHLIGLLSGIGTSIGYITINKLSGYYDRRAIVLSFLLTGLAVSVISMIFSINYQNPDFDFILSPSKMPVGTDWFLLFAMGTIAVLGQILITRAFSFGKPALVGPINYMQIPFTMIIGALLGDLLPDAYSYIGIIFIMTSGMLIIFFAEARSSLKETSETVV